MNNIYPFANLEIGDCFLYDTAPYMKVGAISCRGRFSNYEVNAIGLTTGYGVHFDNSTIIHSIDNQWKEYRENVKQELKIDSESEE